MEYLPIRVSTLRGDQKIDFNAYVKINDKYILYVRKGDSFEGDRLVRLKEKKVKKMFIVPTEETTYRQYLVRNIEMAYDPKSGKSVEARAEIIQGAQQNHLEEIVDNPGDPVSYNAAKDAAGQFVNFLLNENKAVASMLYIQNTDNSMAHHGVNVATLTLALAQKLQMHENKLNPLLTLGALLHDFGHFHSKVPGSAPMASLSADDTLIYKTHPATGVELVKQQKHFDTLVLKIILHHEECIDGSGFPSKLSEREVEPLSILVSSANALDRLMSFEGLDKKQALKNLTLQHVGRHPLAHIQALTEIINQNT